MTIGFDKNAYALASDELQKRSRNHAEEFLKKAIALSPLDVELYFYPTQNDYERRSKRTFQGPIYLEEHNNRVTIHICMAFLKDIPLPALQGWIDQELALCLLRRQPEPKQFNFRKQILPAFPISGAGVNFIRHMVERLKNGLELYLAINILIDLGHGTPQIFFYYCKINPRPEEGDSYRRIISHGWTRASFLCRKLKEIMPITLLSKKKINFSKDIESFWWQYHQYLVKEDRGFLQEIADLPEQFVQASYSMNLIKMLQALYKYLMPTRDERTNSKLLH
jgi:hypothetical protein